MTLLDTEKRDTCASDIIAAIFVFGKLACPGPYMRPRTQSTETMCAPCMICSRGVETIMRVFWLEDEFCPPEGLSCDQKSTLRHKRLKYELYAIFNEEPGFIHHPLIRDLILSLIHI